MRSLPLVLSLAWYSIAFVSGGLSALADEWPVVWKAQTDGYHTYRIPAIVRAHDGALVAFCEGRREGQGDAGDIDLLVKRSTDGGKSWSKQAVVWDDGKHTCGNPCPVVDRKTGTIVLLMTWNRGDDKEPQIIDQTSRDTRRVYVARSTDHGNTWSAPQDITADTKADDWTWYATGPGAGIQIERGPHAGRIVIPCDHIEAKTKAYFAHVIYSDDQGATWKRGGRTPQAKVNECQVVELSDGRLLLNMRNYDRTHMRRQIALSSDGGATWANQKFDDGLIEPICQASIRRATWPDENSKKPGLIAFSNPAHEKNRANLVVRGSLDDGTSWPLARVLHAGPAAYSDLVILKENSIGCLFECGDRTPYEKIVFAAIKAEELGTNGGASRK